MPELRIDERVLLVDMKDFVSQRRRKKHSSTLNKVLSVLASVATISAGVATFAPRKPESTNHDESQKQSVIAIGSNVQMTQQHWDGTGGQVDVQDSTAKECDYTVCSDFKDLENWEGSAHFVHHPSDDATLYPELTP
ncbi:MAG: hypothetical protein RLZZ324_1241, partial [Candidatus Parcubacteria bacterium]